jgi:tryptophan synthase alpha chain
MKLNPTFGPEALVSAAFARCAAQRRAAFVPFLVAGDPNPIVSRELFAAVARAGADLIEVGIPFSDPIADGPVIARSATRALSNGMTLTGALRLARGLRDKLDGIPLIGFCYYNPLYIHGLERAAQGFAANGFAGAIVPDLPLEESEPLRAAFGRLGLVVPQLVSPTTPDERAVRLAAAATGFIYVVSRVGVTGTHAHIGAVVDRVELLRRFCSTPIVVGFGVATAEDAARLACVADGVVVGSALVERVAAAHAPADALSGVARLCGELTHACLRAKVGPETHAVCE